MGVNLTGVLGDLAGALPSSSDLVSQIITGAVATTFLAGLKTDAGIQAVDPFHIFHQNGGSTVVGKSITAAAFSALQPAAQTAVLNAGYVIAG